MTLETEFEAERDSACRATIIRSLTDIPVAYDGHSGHPGKPITELMITDKMKRYLIKVWRLTEQDSETQSQVK